MEKICRYRIYNVFTHCYNIYQYTVHIFVYVYCAYLYNIIYAHIYIVLHMLQVHSMFSFRKAEGPVEEVAALPTLAEAEKASSFKAIGPAVVKMP